MAAIPYTVRQYNALVAAHASGATRITIEGRTTEFGSQDAVYRQLLKVKAELEAAGLLDTTQIPIRRIRVIASKGLDGC